MAMFNSYVKLPEVSMKYGDLMRVSLGFIGFYKVIMGYNHQTWWELIAILIDMNGDLTAVYKLNYNQKLDDLAI